MDEKTKMEMNEQIVNYAKKLGWNVRPYRFAFCLYDGNDNCLGCSIGRPTLADWVECLPRIDGTENEIDNIFDTQY